MRIYQSTPRPPSLGVFLAVLTLSAYESHLTFVRSSTLIYAARFHISVTSCTLLPFLQRDVITFQGLHHPRGRHQEAWLQGRDFLSPVLVRNTLALVSACFCVGTATTDPALIADTPRPSTLAIFSHSSSKGYRTKAAPFTSRQEPLLPGACCDQS